MQAYRFRSKVFLIVSLVFWVASFSISCNSPTTCNYGYKTSDAEYCVNGVLSSNEIEDGRFIFYELKDKSFVEAGFFQNGFRNGKWEYDNKREIQTIEWGYYKDENLGIETNVFAKIDSVKYGPFFSKLKFQGQHGDIILAWSINGPFKDSIPEQNYVRNTTNEFRLLGIVPTNIKSNTLKDNRHVIYLNDFFVRDSSGKEAIIRNLFCRINSALFIEMSVRCAPGDAFTASALFEAVLTNSYINKFRVYNPFVR